MARQRKLVLAPTALNVALALTSVPVTYYFNKGAKNLKPQVMTCMAGVVMAAFVFLVRRAIPTQRWIFYGFSLFSFTCVIDILLSLEIDGFITNYMDMYVKNGEPYLFSAWGVITAYWDGVFNLLCYLAMGYFISNGLSYRNLAILYSSNILNSMVVLLVGACLSHTGLHWSTLLNIPYVLVPLYVLCTALAEPQAQKGAPRPTPVPRLLAVALLTAASAFSCLRGIASMGSRVAVMSYYRESVEPILNQKIPAPFAGVQGIVCLFYFAPAYLVLAIALYNKYIRPWVKNLAIVATGAALQAEVALLGMERHPLTQNEHRLSPNADVADRSLYWAAHVLTLVAPLAAILATCCTRNGGDKNGDQAQMLAKSKQQGQKKFSKKDS